MTEVEGKGVAIVTHGIALKAVTLLFVQDPELDSTPSLKSESLLINAHPLPWNPHVASVVVQLVEETLQLPKRILFGLLLCVFTEVKHSHELSEVLLMLDSSDCPLATGHLLVHCL